jgi:hypothetical protein
MRRLEELAGYRVYLDANVFSCISLIVERHHLELSSRSMAASSSFGSDIFSCS